MPRSLRLQFAGAVLPRPSRGNRRQPIFLESDDHGFHLWWLNKVSAECEWETFAFVHMTNHFHMLVRTPKANLSRGMQRLNGLYAQVFNSRHDLSGHVFQGRFHAELVGSESHLLECARYNDLNPVRAGLCEHPLDWRWSSCRATLGLVPEPGFLDSSWLLGCFGRDIHRARQRYLEFVEDGLDRDR